MMRALPLLAGALLALPAAPAAAQTDWKPCTPGSFTYRGHQVTGLKQHAMGCTAARAIIKRLIAHGRSGFRDYYCSGAARDKRHSIWICTGHNHGGEQRVLATIEGFAPSARAVATAASVQTCSDITHHGYFATGFREQNIGCHAAHGLARHIIDHGPSGLHQWSCSRSFLPKNVTLWNCGRQLHGEVLKLEFGLRPL